MKKKSIAQKITDAFKVNGNIKQEEIKKETNENYKRIAILAGGGLLLDKLSK